MLQILTPSFIKVAAAIVTVITLMDEFIIYDMKFPTADLLDGGCYMVYWRRSGIECYNNSTLGYVQIALISLRLLADTIVDLRDIFTGFAFIVAIFPLWLLSLKFNEIGPGNTGEHVVMKKYRQIFRLTRLFDKAHGSALFCFFFNYLVYYSTRLDRIIAPLSAGQRFFDLQFIFIIVLVYALGASFSRKVGLII